jgi:hypothetical protein
VDDAMKVTLTGGNTNHDICPILNATSFLGQQVTFEFDYYIPSSNALVDNLFNQNTFSSVTSSTSNLDVLDAWTSVVIEGVTKFAPENIDTFIRARANTSQTFDADGDVFYLKNIRITQLTADGCVHTWYDQSANANHAVQGTDSEQPKIVDAGSVLLFNSKPCIIPDGVDDNLLFTNITSTSHYISIVGGDTTKGRCLSSSTSYLNFIESGTNNRYRIDGTIYNLSARILDVQNLITWTRVTTNSNFYQNSVLNTNSTVIANALDLGQLFKNTGDSGTSSDGKFQEVIIYDSDKSSNRTGIETNINTYYNIY